jgi:hypothetical protein
MPLCLQRTLNSKFNLGVAGAPGAGTFSLSLYDDHIVEKADLYNPKADL